MACHGNWWKYWTAKQVLCSLLQRAFDCVGSTAAGLNLATLGQGLAQQSMSVATEFDSDSVRWWRLQLGESVIVVCSEAYQ